MSDPADAVTEMLVRTVPGAPAHLLADAAEKFRRIIDNERRRAIVECKSALIAAGVDWASQIIDERVLK